MTQVTTNDGRTLAVSEGGDDNGFPVLVHHGTPGSRTIYSLHDRLAREQGIRLITYDRPGYGDSDPDTGRNVADCVADVHAIADVLDLDQFASWGISGGGPHVLACAALCDERLVAVASLAAVAPYVADDLDWFEGMGDDNIEEFGAVVESADALTAYLDVARAGHLAAKADELIPLMLSLLGPEDQSVLTASFADWMLDSGNQGLAPGIAGWFDDDVAFATPWGFDVAEIDRPVLLLHGDDDRFVPVAHARWLATRIPGVEARIDANDGHLTLLERRVGEAHAWLLAQR